MYEILVSLHCPYLAPSPYLAPPSFSLQTESWLGKKILKNSYSYNLILPCQYKNTTIMTFFILYYHFKCCF